MKCFAGSGGHNSIVQGANSVYGKEHVEDRRFLDAVAKYVQAAGWKYVNCSDEVGTTKSMVWGNAANNHLRVTNSAVDLQFHLNATPGGTGCEVWLHPKYGNRELAAKISKAMANAFGLNDRGIKFSTELGWINKTKTGLLPEICFIDNEHDMKQFHANFDKAAKAVAEVIVGGSISVGESNPSVSTPVSPSKDGIGIAYITGTNVNLRNAPSTSGAVLRKLNVPESYIVWAEKDGWLNLGGDQWMKNDSSFVRFERYGGGSSGGSYVGKRVVSKVNGLNFYDRPTWNKAYVAGTVDAGYGFEIIDKVNVDGSPQYKVKNSKGAIYYITASETYVSVK